METFFAIVLGIILGLVVSNTIILIRLTFDLIINKQEQKDDAKYKGHYTCKKCGESMDFSTLTLVEYCPFCGEEYREAKK